jgi:hypothetical protein
MGLGVWIGVSGAGSPGGALICVLFGLVFSGASGFVWARERAQTKVERGFDEPAPPEPPEPPEPPADQPDPPPDRTARPVHIELYDAGRAPPISKQGLARADRLAAQMRKGVRNLRIPGALLVASSLVAAVLGGDWPHATESLSRWHVVAGSAAVLGISLAPWPDALVTWAGRGATMGVLGLALLAGLDGAFLIGVGEPMAWATAGIQGVAIAVFVGLVIQGKRAKGEPDAGRPLVVLWVFDAGAQTHDVLRRLWLSWSSQSPMLMLSGPGDTLDTNEVAAVLGGGTGRITLQTPDQVAPAVDNALAQRIGGQFAPAEPIRCGDGVWKVALHAFLARDPVVLFDLCRYSSERAGCQYEFDALAQALHPSQVVHLIDYDTDLERLRADLIEAWQWAPGQGPVTLGVWRTHGATVTDVETGLYRMLCEGLAAAQRT